MDFGVKRETATATNVSASGEVTIRVRLNTSPDDEWRRIFDGPLPTYRTIRFQKPRLLGGDVVDLTVAAGDEQAAIQQLDGQIAATNEKYAEMVIPERERLQSAMSAAAAEKQRIRAESQARLDAIPPPE